MRFAAKCIAACRLLARARLARFRARRGLPPAALQVADFSFRTGLRLLMRGAPGAFQHLIAPVEGTRYLEFPFVLRYAPRRRADCLDVSSPRAVSLFLARNNPAAAITMLNPDARDLAESRKIAGILGLSRIRFQEGGCERLREWRGRFDCIWSVSVIEHVAGEYDDRQAVRWMYDALKPGGRLLLTVPADKTFWTEYRAEKLYGTQPQAGDGRYFFQRFYDEAAVRDRIIAAAGAEPEAVAWFGEKENGRFHAYIRRLMERGLFVHANDPVEMAVHYREFNAWADMPGAGVCCLVFRKPPGGAQGGD